MCEPSKNGVQRVEEWCVNHRRPSVIVGTKVVVGEVSKRDGLVCEMSKVLDLVGDLSKYRRHGFRNNSIE